MKQKGFFDEADRLEELSKPGDPLEKLNRYMKWEELCGILTRALKKEAAGAGGGPPFDYVMMFKILILQKLYNVSDGQTGCRINGRLSFQRFLGLQLCDKAPGAKTIWHFREELREAKIPGTAFCRFVRQLEKQGVITHSGSIAGAAFAGVPKQRDTGEENGEIKEGRIPKERQKKKNRHKAAQKDAGARRMTKNKERHFGYKDHIKAGKKSKIITKYRVTGAEAHDSRELKNLIEGRKDRRLYGGSAYTGEEVQKRIPKRVLNRIHEKGYRNRPLSETRKRNNTAKSRIRARAEHVFAAMNHFGGIMIRSIGIAGAGVQIGLLNLAYNLTRYAYLMEAKT